VGITSHDVVARVRRILKTKRVGHTGTLDPFATGVMVILVGRATRLAQFLDKDEKEYEASIRFGFETDTGDRTGMRSKGVEISNAELCDLLVNTNWDDVFSRFRGDIEQVPPMYSAKKVEGKKLYELARRGVEVERKSVKVAINKLEFIDDRELHDPNYTLRIKVACSAGTYIRTLAEDIGRQVGVFAHLTELRRMRAGKFDISKSLTLDDLKNLDDPLLALSPMNEAVMHLPEMILTPDRVAKTRGGLSTRMMGQKYREGETVRMQDERGDLIAIGFYDEAENSVQPKIVLV
jgi:tRNA pseudouridine55 synthase